MTSSPGIIGRSYARPPRIEVFASIDFTNVAVTRNCVRCGKPAGRQLVRLAKPIATCPHCKHQWRARFTRRELDEYRTPRTHGLEVASR